MKLDLLLLQFNHLITLFIIFPAMIALGCYLTIKLKFIQISKINMGFRSLLQKGSGEEGNISHFEAISAVLAGNFGTGNISGMAVALTTGGPGALVWMWIMAFFGAAIQYGSCLLAVKYRQKNNEGEYVGGPMYYLRDGLNSPLLGMLFAVFTLFASFAVGNLAQINSVMLPLEKLGYDPLIGSVLIALLVGVVIVGGIRRLAGLASYIVPIKAALYLGAAFIIIGLNIEKLLPSLKLMFFEGFNLSTMTGGVMGFGVLKALTTGFDRGIFATDAGTGIVPILQASARTKSPVIDGVVTLVAPLMVMIVCTSTGLVLLMTGAWQQSGLHSTNMVTYAFEKGLGSQAGTYLVIGALVLFAYTTILAWAYCGEKALGFLIGTQHAAWFRYVYIALIPLGTLLKVDLIWALADTTISLMLIVNMVGIAGLSSYVFEETKQYFDKAYRLS